MNKNQPHRPTVASLLGLLAYHVRSLNETVIEAAAAYWAAQHAVAAVEVAA